MDNIGTVDNGQRVFVGSHGLEVLLDPRDQLVLALHVLQDSLEWSCARLPRAEALRELQALGHTLLAACREVQLRMALLALGCP